MPERPVYPREHPVPTHREVIVTALDERTRKVPVETLLAERGFDLTLPYREEPWEGDGRRYVQDIPGPEAA